MPISSWRDFATTFLQYIIQEGLCNDLSAVYHPGGTLQRPLLSISSRRDFATDLSKSFTFRNARYVFIMCGVLMATPDPSADDGGVSVTQANDKSQAVHRSAKTLYKESSLNIISFAHEMLAAMLIVTFCLPVC
jgi:hypothetical protein